MQSLENYGKGALREKKDRRITTLKRHLKKFGATITPTYYDLTDLYAQFPTENQGQSSACSGYSFGGYAQVKTFKRDGKVVILSKKDIYQNIFSPGGGAFGLSASRYLENNGVCLESYIPSSDKGMPPSEGYMENIIPRTQEAEKDGLSRIFQNFATFNGKDINEVKQAILNGDGAVCALWGSNASWLSRNGVVDIPDVPAKSKSLWGHFVILVGWDDVGNNYPGKNLVKCKSSWGEDVGDKGYFYIPYDYFTRGYSMAEYTGVEYPSNYVPTLKDKIINLILNIISILQRRLDDLQGAF